MFFSAEQPVLRRVGQAAEQAAWAAELDSEFVETPVPASREPGAIAAAPKKMSGRLRSSTPKKIKSICRALPRGYQNHAQRESSSRGKLDFAR